MSTRLEKGDKSYCLFGSLSGIAFTLETHTRTIVFLYFIEHLDTTELNEKKNESLAVLSWRSKFPRNNDEFWNYEIS